MPVPVAQAAQTAIDKPQATVQQQSAGQSVDLASDEKADKSQK